MPIAERSRARRV